MISVQPTMRSSAHALANELAAQHVREADALLHEHARVQTLQLLRMRAGIGEHACIKRVLAQRPRGVLDLEVRHRLAGECCQLLGVHKPVHLRILFLQATRHPNVVEHERAR